MKKIYLVLFTAALATTFAACSKDDAATAITSYEEIVKAQPVPVTFGTYLNESATTRAGYAGNINDAVLSGTAADGFGVFAYYTKDKVYPKTKGASTGTEALWTGGDALYPNFMYNQHVIYQSSSWFYTPLKYWPNETNPNDNNTNNATSTRLDKISFFAYAPYVAVGQTTAANVDGADPASGAVNQNATSGIMHLSGNAWAGNPTISYTIGSDGKNVDLLWGTAGTTSGTDIHGTTQAGGIVVIDDTHDGLANVNINMSKQKIGGKVDFLFKHALAKIGFKVQADPDVPVANSEIYTGSVGKTLITVKKIEISTPASANYPDDVTAPVSGKFDLATGVWTPDTNADNVTITKHTIDATATADNSESNTWKMNVAIAEPSSAPTASAGAWSDLGNLTGVQATSATDVYPAATAPNPTTAMPIVYIPGSKPCLIITIEYVIRTADANLKDGFSEVTQKITKTLTFTNAVELNKQYDVLMKLGITGIKFSATVSGWDTPTDVPVNLPINVN